MSKFSTSLAIVGLLNPAGVQALGIGEIKLQSYLNQTLRAEIPLVLSNEAPDDIRVALAPPGAFEAAGLERSAVLAKLRFLIEPGRKGGFVIRVRSSEIIREPFLNFLLEVSWPEGRMLRTFTLLLDPPDFSTVHSFPPAVEEIETAATVPPSSSAAPPPVHTTGGTYGPVAKNEKLWSIAEKINRDPAITTEQMVLALFRLNPQAFSRPNVNALAAGSLLSIPDRATILSTSPSLAREEFYRQQGARAARGSAERNRLGRPDAPEQRPAVAVGDAPDRLSQPAAAAPWTQNDAGMQAIEALKRENEQMRSRLAELERRLSELQVLIEEKDTLAANRTPGATREPQAVVPADSAGTAAIEAPAPAANPAASPTVTATIPATNPAQATAAGAAAAAPAPPPAASAIGPAAAPPAAPPPTPARAPVVVTAAATAPAVGQSELTPVAWLLTVAGTVVAGFWPLFRLRRSMKSRASQKNPAEAAESPSTGAISLADQTGGSGIAAAPLAVCAPAEVDEVDPVFEADIYLSYAKFGQAKETIEEAIRKHPERAVYRLKLLEVILAGGDIQGFDDAVAELRKQPEFADPSFWERVGELSRRHQPEGRPDTAPTAPGPSGRDAAVRPTDDTDRLIDDLKRFSIEARATSHQTDQERSAHEIAWEPPDAGISAPPPVTPAEEETPAIGSDDLMSFAAKEADSTEPVDLSAFEEEAASQSIESLLKELSALHYERHLNDEVPQTPRAPADDESCGDIAQPMSSEAGPGNDPQADARCAAAAEDAPAADVGGDLETKLDLARAYADMGDFAQATAFLHEVMDRGTAVQRAEAAELLASFSGV